MTIINNDFKTIQLVCYNSAIDQKETRVFRYLLAKLLVSHTDKYTSKLSMSIQLEALYGALLSARTELNANINTVMLSMTIANPQIVGDETLLNDAIAFFKSVIFDHKSFDASIFEEEKRLLIEQWQSLKDQKSKYANFKFNQLFRSPDLTGYPISGTLAEIKKVTLESLESYYKHTFLSEDMHLIINGHIEPFYDKQLENLASKTLQFETTFRKPRPLKEVVESTDMKQAMIYLGYTYPVYRFDALYEAALLTHLIIGGYPESRMFKIIREQKALCYDIRSQYDMLKGTFMISSGVAIDMVDEAKNAMIALVNQTIVTGVTAHELSTAKRYMIHQFKAGLDHQSYFTTRAYFSYITQKQSSIEDRIHRLEQVTLEEVSTVLKQLTLDTIYILKGEAS